MVEADLRTLFFVIAGLLSISSGAQAESPAKPGKSEAIRDRDYGTSTKDICGTMKGTKFTSSDKVMVDVEMEGVPHADPFDLPAEGEMCLKLRFDKGHLVEIMEDAKMVSYAKPAKRAARRFKEYGTSRREICGTMTGTKFTSSDKIMMNVEMEGVPHADPFDLPAGGEMCLKLRFDKGLLVEVLEDARMVNHAPRNPVDSVPQSEISH